MAYIYKITNDINGKVYIGKTMRTVQKRFDEHKRQCKQRNREHYPLYRAIKKYGLEHFHVEQIEETDNPEERERYWIKYYDSFNHGYNATIGGDGAPYVDYDLVVATYKELQNMTKTAQKLGIDNSTVSIALHDKKQKTLSAYETSAAENSKVVNQYTKNGEYIQSFPSCIEAARSLNRITTTSNGASSHISDVCCGKRKTTYGFIWKFNETE